MSFFQKFMIGAERHPNKAVSWIIRQCKALRTDKLPAFIKFLVEVRRQMASFRVLVDWAIGECCDRLSYAVTHPLRPY